MRYGDYRRQIDKIMGIEKDDSAYIDKSEKTVSKEIIKLKRQLRKEQMLNRQHKNKQQPKNSPAETS